MDDHLAYFLELRVRLRGRSEAIAIVDRCIRPIARAEGASADELAELQREVGELRGELIARFGPKASARIPEADGPLERVSMLSIPRPLAPDSCPIRIGRIVALSSASTLRAPATERPVLWQGSRSRSRSDGGPPMPMYTFHLYGADDHAITFDAVELAHDAATFARAGELLDEHLSCDRVEVWQGERGVLARHRFQPVIRPVYETQQASRRC